MIHQLELTIAHKKENMISFIHPHKNVKNFVSSAHHSAFNAQASSNSIVSKIFENDPVKILSLKKKFEMSLIPKTNN